MTFHDPSVWLLGLLVLAPLPWWRWMSRRRATVAYSAVEPLRAAGRSWAIRARPLVPLLRMVALALLAVCLARPIKADEQTRVLVEGIAIQLVVDRSGTMQALDFILDGKQVNRLEAVKAIVTDFVGGDGAELSGRPDDLIGLIAFARYADSISPVTLDHAHLVQALRHVEIANTQEEDGTAIGDAIALGVERLRHLRDRAEGGRRRQVTSRVMVLLTDGENNAGDIDPITAAEMAEAFDIRIYTIGAGTRGEAPFPVRDANGRVTLRRFPVNIDEDTLKAIAEATGGRYFRATDTDSLREIYREIDRLEKTETEERRYAHFTDLAVESVDVAGYSLPPLLIIVFACLALELALRVTRLRTLP